ncbi:MAG: hypothetical protein ABJZ55_01900 [Fuerstiella sp.]
MTEVTTSNKGVTVLDELRDFLVNYLQQPGSMSIREIGRRVDLSHVAVRNFRDGGRLYFDSAVLIAEVIGYDLSKSLKSVA